MLAPTRGADTNEIQIQIDWLALTTVDDTGDSAITAYQLMWDDQTKVVDIVASENL